MVAVGHVVAGFNPMNAWAARGRSGAATLGLIAAVETAAQGTMGQSLVGQVTSLVEKGLDQVPFDKAGHAGDLAKAALRAVAYLGLVRGASCTGKYVFQNFTGAKKKVE